MTDGICIDIRSHKKFREPRYDDVYFQGVKWLDSLAREPNVTKIEGWDDEVDTISED